MYKRPARVLFLTESGRRFGQWVSELANEQHADFLQARSAALVPGTPVDTLDDVLTISGVEVRPSRLPLVCPGDIDWADLIITLDEAARRHTAQHIPSKPTRHWTLPKGDECEMEASLNEIMERLRSMAGGMRMLERLDAGDAGAVPP